MSAAASHTSPAGRWACCRPSAASGCPRRRCGQRASWRGGEARGAGRCSRPLPLKAAVVAVVSACGSSYYLAVSAGTEFISCKHCITCASPCWPAACCRTGPLQSRPFTCPSCQAPPLGLHPYCCHPVQPAAAAAPNPCMRRSWLGPCFCCGPAHSRRCTPALTHAVRERGAQRLPGGCVAACSFALLEQACLVSSPDRCVGTSLVKLGIHCAHGGRRQRGGLPGGGGSRNGMQHSAQH